ncbi:hypothetical protein TRIUR3_33862 [Triticum urartu]|uniref:Uncharacterized protein n=1 Tax=Triticum urartu TaxID=4572 RepID=M8AUB4_TRIUA|nr:hypothetical protein TRIUR3_33862 [Triticum urartu]
MRVDPAAAGDEGIGRSSRHGRFVCQGEGRRGNHSSVSVQTIIAGDGPGDDSVLLHEREPGVFDADGETGNSRITNNTSK